MKIWIYKSGTSYDITELVEKTSWSGRKGAAPRCCKISLLDDDGSKHNRITVDCADGDKLMIYDDNGKEKFRGLIESHTQGSSKKMSIVAYDNMYYLANNKDSFSYKNKRADQIFDDVMKRAGLKVGGTVNTGYVIPELPKSKTTYWDVLLDALSSTYKATGKRYYISSEKGKIYLRRRKENTLQWVLEIGTNITSYSYTKSIANIKTRIRLLSKNNAVVYEKKNTALESKIGVFQDVKSVDKSYNKAQMKELVESMIEENGSPVKTLNVSGIDIPDAISGACVYVIIPHLGLSRTFYIDQDSHDYTGKNGIMTLKLNFAKDIDAAG